MKDSTQYLRGRCSLPLFIGKIKNMKDTVADSQTARAFRDCLIDFINTKNMLGYRETGLLDLSLFVHKATKHEEFMKAVQESRGIGTKPIFEAHNLTEEELQSSFANLKLKKPSHCIKDFSILDDYTSQAIHLHQLANQKKNLAAVHSRIPSEVFVSIGGFKNMYPLVENVIKSNLYRLNCCKPGEILKWVFIILNSLLHSEPAHVNFNFRSRNLLMTLKFILLKVGMQQMITSELLTEVKNIIKKNVLARFRFIEVNQVPSNQANHGKPTHLT